MDDQNSRQAAAIAAALHVGQNVAEFLATALCTLLDEGLTPSCR